jgi:hypothetical protein
MGRLTKEQVIWGLEPSSDVSIHSALYWYRNMKSNTIKKEWAIKFLCGMYNYTQEQLNKIPEFYLSAIGAMSRMLDRGFEFDDSEFDKIKEKVDKLVLKYDIPTEPKITKKYPSQINPVADKIGKQMTQFDLVIDSLVTGVKKNWDKPILDDTLNKSNLVELQRYYAKELQELLLAYERDEVVSELYNIPRLSLRRVINYHNDILDLLSKQISVKSTRVVKKKKQSKVSPVRKLKFLRVDTNTGVSSINPEKIIGATKLVVFNIKNRQLIVYKSLNGGFTVSGTTLKNFDSETSFGKILRKPKDQLPIFVTSAKLKTDKLFDDINSVPKSVTGRINASCVLVRVFK